MQFRNARASADPAYEGSLRSAGTPAMAAPAPGLWCFPASRVFDLGLGLFLDQHQRHSEKEVGRGFLGGSE